MIANNLIVFVDACALAGALKRNLLLTLAEATFFRIQWSAFVLTEAERAIADILSRRGIVDACARAARARAAMESAFEEAMVTDFDHYLFHGDVMPDKDDAHVVAAAVKSRSSFIVTDNVKDFPANLLDPLRLVAISTDLFIANLIKSDIDGATIAIRTMRLRFKRPEKHAEALLVDMDAVGLVATVDVLRPYAALL